MLETPGAEAYALVDSGNGRKLERFGDMLLVRPEEQAIWSPRLAERDWAAADAVFTGDTDEEGAGRWRRSGGSEEWICREANISYSCRLTSFRHVGVFPEQAAHWHYMSERLQTGPSEKRLLNLFGYTGLASLIAAQAGAQVTHVDASKKAIAWARENQAMSGLSDLPIRWICEDAVKFAAREVRRGNTYDGILLDPPKFGRGPKNETWRLFEDLPDMLRLCRDLVDPKSGFLILTAYAIRASFVTLDELVKEILGGRTEAGELLLVEDENKTPVDQGADKSAERRRRLSTSLFSRWRPS